MKPRTENSGNKQQQQPDELLNVPSTMSTKLLENNSNTAKNTVDLSVDNKSSSPEANEENRSAAVKNKEGLEEEI